MSDKSKTPYELRFNMYEAGLERLKEAFYSKVEANRQERDEHYELSDKGYLTQEEPVFPTAQDAIKEAKLIMAFVNGDKQ